MIQLGLIIAAIPLLWEGSKGFRKCGIKLGLVKSGGDPITGTTGMLIGSIIMAIGGALLFIALVYIPFFAGV